MTETNMTLAGPGLEQWFEPNPLLLGWRRGELEAQLERFKERLLEPVLGSVENVALVQELRWVANEAAALAWSTVCPFLMLPTLLEEKVLSALKRWELQQTIRQRQAGGSKPTEENLR